MSSFITKQLDEQFMGYGKETERIVDAAVLSIKEDWPLLQKLNFTWEYDVFSDDFRMVVANMINGGGTYNWKEVAFRELPMENRVVGQKRFKIVVDALHGAALRVYYPYCEIYNYEQHHFQPSIYGDQPKHFINRMLNVSQQDMRKSLDTFNDGDVVEPIKMEAIIHINKNFRYASILSRMSEFTNIGPSKFMRDYSATDYEQIIDFLVNHDLLQFNDALQCKIKMGYKVNPDDVNDTMLGSLI